MFSGHKIFIKSGNLIETYEYEKQIPERRKSTVWGQRKSGKSADTGTNHRDRTAMQRSDSCIRRSRSAFRRLVGSNLFGTKNPILLTLTMFEVLPYEASVGVFHRFIARLRREEGKHFRYIAVPEFQKRGAVHFHVILWGIPHEKVETETTTRYFARLWLRGFCDCVATDGHPRLVSYLSKYLQKHMQDLRLGGKKAYYASRNIVRPMRISSRAELFEDYVKLIPVDNCLRKHEFTTQWLGRVIYKSYAVKIL